MGCTFYLMNKNAVVVSKGDVKRELELLKNKGINFGISTVSLQKWGIGKNTKDGLD